MKYPPEKRVVVWFSCGAASAVAAKLVLQERPDAVLAYCDTGSEHPDNLRFLNECQKWLGVNVTVLRSSRYQDTWDVFQKTKYLVGPRGARCTTELKKKVRQNFEDLENDVQVFGFDIAERERAARFQKNNPEVVCHFPLIDAGISKIQCLEFLSAAGVGIPEMYRLGYANNNCIGCVKGQAGYWNKIRRDFPDVFARMAKLERDLNVAICKSYAGDGKRKRVFLDQLDPNAGKYSDLNVECGVLCG